MSESPRNAKGPAGVVATTGLVSTIGSQGGKPSGRMLVEVEPLEFAADDSEATPVWQVTFDDVHVGDCRLRAGLMYIYDDGTYDCAGDYMSTDTNDVWHQSFRWLDANKSEIARSAETFIAINDSDTWKRWVWKQDPRKPETPILRDNVSRIGWVELRCRC